MGLLRFLPSVITALTVRKYYSKSVYSVQSIDYTTTACIQLCLHIPVSVVVPVPELLGRRLAGVSLLQPGNRTTEYGAVNYLHTLYSVQVLLGEL